ncbi:glycosyltransferase family 2 protein [Endothiovibrio diazotrophicus]
MAQPLVSIVMLCWNRREDVDDVLGRIAEVEYPRLEVIVVDNASHDGTAEMVAERHPRARLLRMAENLGIAGYNAGFEAARGEYVVVLDDDSYPAPDALGRMVERFAADPKLGVVAFDVRNAASFQWRPGAAPAAPGAAVAYQMSFNGAGFGIRRVLFEQVGWYPAEFFLYWNEQDTAFRVLDAGYRIETHDDIIALHKFSPRNRASERAPFFYTRNAFWMVWKNYPLDLALTTTARLIHRCLYHALEQRSSVYLRAMWAAFRDGGCLRGKRKPVAREIVNGARVAFENAFAQFR